MQKKQTVTQLLTNRGFTIRCYTSILEIGQLVEYAKCHSKAIFIK